MEEIEIKDTWKKCADLASFLDVLDSVQEECAELIQACSKYKRAYGHGLPTDCPTEKAIAMLTEETAHVQNSCDLLIYKLGLDVEKIKKEQDDGIKKIYNRFLKMEDKSNV